MKIDSVEERDLIVLEVDIADRSSIEAASAAACVAAEKVPMTVLGVPPPPNGVQITNLTIRHA